MELLKALALQSPNTWGRAPILEVWVAQSPDRQNSPAQLAAVADRLVDLANPYLLASEIPGPEANSHTADAASAKWLPASWLEHLTRKLQSLCGVEMPVGRVIVAPNGQFCRVGIYFEDEGLVRKALDIAHGLIEAAIEQKSYEFAVRLRELQSLANELCFGPSTRAIVRAARSRCIPVRRLNENSFVQFGLGAQQRRICTAETDGTGAIAESIAQDKELTKVLLARVGVPVPKGRTAGSPEEAWQAALEVGLPVVVKPVDGNHGRGVAIKLSDRDRIMTAYESAAAEGSGVLIEQFVAGRQTRLLVVGNRLVAASRAEPEQVVGDGVHTISELVDLVNLDPRRGDEYALPMSRMKLNASALVELAEQGYDPASVVPAGAIAVLHRHGEYTTDVTDHVHPEVAARAILATRVVGLDVAGIDMVLEDVGRPMEVQGGMVIEVNAGPGLQMHAEPQVGQARPVGAAIVETLFPAGQTGRIPIVAVTGGVGATVTAQVAAHLMRQSGLNVGLACAAGTFVGGRRLATRNPQQGPAELFLNPLVEAGVFEISSGVVYNEGLAFDYCDVAVISPTAATAEAGDDNVHEPDAWRRIVANSVSPQGVLVLCADDSEDTGHQTESCHGETLFYAFSEADRVLQSRRLVGDKVVFVRDGAIWGASEENEIRLGPWNISAQSHARAVLAGVAAAWAAGASTDSIERGQESMDSLLAESSAGASKGSSEAAGCSEQPRVA